MLMDTLLSLYFDFANAREFVISDFRAACTEKRERNFIIDYGIGQ